MRSKVMLVVVIVSLVITAWDGKPASAGELLYNGIELPNEWPPNYGWSRQPMPVPYLKRRAHTVVPSIQVTKEGNHAQNFHHFLVIPVFFQGLGAYQCSK